MADPATQFQQAGLNVPYQFTPTHYVPTAVNVPTEAGALLAKAGETAMSGGKMLLQSPLNPAVRAQQQADIATAQQTLSHINWLNNLGDKAHWLQGISPDGRVYVRSPAEISDPTLASLFGYPGTGKDGAEPTPPEKQKTPEAAPAKPPTTEEQAKPGTPPTTEGQAKPSVQTTSPASSLFASTPSTSPPALPARPYLSASAAPGPIPTTARGEPGYTAEPAQPQGNVPVTDRGPVWNPLGPAPAQPQPAAAPQPQAEPGGMMDQYARDYAAGHAQGQEARRQQDLANWQQTTQTEPMTADDAMKYMRRKTTLAQDATYLPHGGPNNEPAYAFHMKGGGVNTVPVSQMLRDGAGPTVAAQNTSATLSQTDRLNQQQQNALVAPPPMQPQPPAQQPTAPIGPQPPAAPSQYPQVASDQGGAQGQPAPPPAPGQEPIPNLAAYTAVPSKGGPPVESLTAGETAAEPAKPGPTTGFQSPITTAGPKISPAQQNALTAQAAKNKDTNEFAGQDQQGQGLTFHRDTDKNSEGYGRLFLSLPPTAGNYYNEQRFYLGSDGYHLFDLPDTYQKQKMNYWVDHGVLSPGQVAGMSPTDMKPWLDQAWKDQKMEKNDPTGGLSEDLNAAEQFHQSMDRIKNLVQTLGGARGESSRYNVMAKVRAAIENATISLGAGGVTKDILADMPPEAAQAIRTLEQEINGAHQLLTDHPHLIMPLGKGGGQETPNVHWESVRLGAPNIPSSTVLDDVFSGQPQTDIMRNLNNLQKRGDFRYREMVDDAQTQWYRFNPRHSANIARFDTDKPIPEDPNNPDAYKSHSLFHSVPSQQQPGSKPAGATVPQLKTMDDLNRFRQQKHPSGTHYQVWDTDQGKYVDFTTK